MSVPFPSSPSVAEQAWNASGSDPPIPVWLDCDTGHDDAFALLVLASSPRVSLLGCSTVFGNAPLEQTTRNTLSILTAIGRTDVPVYTGAAGPFCRDTCFAPDIHGASGLDGTTCLPAPAVGPSIGPSALQAAYEALIATPPATAYVVATGTLTNVALLFAVYPQLASHIAGLHIMGGAVGGGFSNAPMGSTSTDDGDGVKERFGNWTPYAEFNIYIDPEAASSVFRHPILRTKMTLVPLDLSHQFLADEHVQKSLLCGFNGPVDRKASRVRKLFNEILIFFAATYRDVFGLIEGPPLHDVLPAIAVFAAHVFDDNGSERFEVSVVIDGPHGTDGVARTSSQVGRTIVRKLAPGMAGVRIPRGLYQLEAWDIIDLCLQQAERTAPEDMK